MNNKIRLGEILRLLREKKDLTVEQLSEKSHSDIEVIKNIEKGEFVPSVKPLLKLARALGVRLGTFLDDQEDIGPVVTKREATMESEKSPRIAYNGIEGGAAFSLAMNKSTRHMEPLLMELMPQEDKITSSHEGEEFLYVLEGTVTVAYGKDTYRLSKGDSIYYDSIVDHEVRAENNPAKILAVLQEPA